MTQRNIPIDKQLFTAYLSSYRDAKDRDHKSFYTFGFIDKKAVGGQPIHYADVDSSQGLWQFQSTTATISDRQVARFDNTAVADTGSSLALIDDSVCAAIYDAIPGARYEPKVQGYIFPTNTTISQLPLVSFAVSDQEFAIQKEDLAFSDAGDGFTYGGIQSRGDLSFDVFGDTFLKSVYSVSQYSRYTSEDHARLNPFRYSTKGIVGLVLFYEKTPRNSPRNRRREARRIAQRSIKILSSAGKGLRRAAPRLASGVIHPSIASRLCTASSFFVPPFVPPKAACVCFWWLPCVCVFYTKRHFYG